MTVARPVVLCISGVDPTGAAGLQAEIEVLHRLGVHAVSLVTALTVQDTRNVAQVLPVALATLIAQWATLQADGVRPQAVKVGLVPDAAQALWVAEMVHGLGVPVIVDPILRAGGGAGLSARNTLAPLLRAATVLTPNLDEAQALIDSPVDRATLAAAVRQHWGVNAVLVTGGDLTGDAEVWHGFADAGGAFEARHPRLPQRFRGAGCTLSAALAGRMALGETPRAALPAAQEATRAALARAWPLGAGRWIPGR